MVSQAERPAAIRILVDVPQCRTHPQGRRCPQSLDSPQASSSVVRCKYRWLFSSRPRPKKPGRKGPSKAVIEAIVELKSRNPRFGCPRIVLIISRTFGINIDKNVVAHVLAKHYRPVTGGTGHSWLAFWPHRQ